MPYQVPIFISSVHIDRIVSIADKIASLLVLGLFSSGTFSIVVVNLPNFPLEVITCVFFVVLGSTIIFTIVSWLPNPTKLKRADTLTFFGNNLTASLAVPSNIVDGSLISSRFCLNCSKL